MKTKKTSKQHKIYADLNAEIAALKAQVAERDDAIKLIGQLNSIDRHNKDTRMRLYLDQVNITIETLKAIKDKLDVILPTNVHYDEDRIIETRRSFARVIDECIEALIVNE